MYIRQKIKFSSRTFILCFPRNNNLLAKFWHQTSRQCESNTRSFTACTQYIIKKNVQLWSC